MTIEEQIVARRNAFNKPISPDNCVAWQDYLRTKRGIDQSRMGRRGPSGSSEIVYRLITSSRQTSSGRS